MSEATPRQVTVFTNGVKSIETVWCYPIEFFPLDDAPESCPICRTSLNDDGSCPAHGNIAQAVAQRRAEQRQDYDADF